jgi:hypothetical protein
MSPPRRVVESPSVASPQVVGCLAPVLVLPSSLLRRSELSDALLLHELAHLRRGDPWQRLAQSLTEAVFFFWPPLRWIHRELDAQRELACDAIALTFSSLPPERYGAGLLDVARSFRAAAGREVGLAAVSSPSRLARRIDMLTKLKPTLNPRTPWLGAALWALLAVALVPTARAGDDKKAAEGTLPKEAIREVIRTHNAEVRQCYEQGLESEPELAGRLVLKFTINQDGAVDSPEVAADSDFAHHAVGACVLEAMQSWSFPKPSGGGVVHVTYPFVLARQPPKP